MQRYVSVLLLPIDVLQLAWFVARHLVVPVRVAAPQARAA